MSYSEKEKNKEKEKSKHTKKIPKPFQFANFLAFINNFANFLAFINNWKPKEGFKLMLHMIFTE